MIIHLFGGKSLVGSAFIDLLSNKNFKGKVIKYSRNSSDKNFQKLDLNNPKNFDPYLSDTESVLISFVPIWILSKFFTKISSTRPEFLRKLKKIIVCSSSSVATKKYAFNLYDKNLSENLKSAENSLIEIGKNFKFETIIIQPSMIYGSYGDFHDKNINNLIKIMRKLSIIFLPRNCGMRQPIHCYELANVFFSLINNNKKSDLDYSKILIGGDNVISYYEMLLLLQKSSSKNDPIRKCKIIIIPDLIFILLSVPFAIVSIKFFEASLRILSNLSDFQKQSTITNKRNSNFPFKK